MLQSWRRESGSAPPPHRSHEQQLQPQHAGNIASLVPPPPSPLQHPPIIVRRDARSVLAKTVPSRRLSIGHREAPTLARCRRSMHAGGGGILAPLWLAVVLLPLRTLSSPALDFPLPELTGRRSQVLFTREQVLRKFAGGRDTVRPCAGCITPVPKSEQEKRTIDKLRIDAIKVQILSKLGLKERPDINSSAIPRDMVFEALRRAEPTINMQGSITDRKRDQNSDDYFGRASEVFMFAESGKFKKKLPYQTFFFRCQASIN